MKKDLQTLYDTIFEDLYPKRVRLTIDQKKRAYAKSIKPIFLLPRPLRKKIEYFNNLIDFVNKHHSLTDDEKKGIVDRFEKEIPFWTQKPKPQ